jgi:Na+/H+ antiporter NhaA
MSFFIANVAFTDPATLTMVKISVILASVLAGLIGWIVLHRLSLVSERRTMVTVQPATSDA